MSRGRILVALALAVPAVIGLLLASPDLSRRLGLPHSREAFPVIDRAALTAQQARVIDVVHQQFDANPPGTHFSAGVQEPWCADFVSWVLHDAGVPVSNPNNGSWRIPGVYTLAEYYKSAGRLAPADYRAKPGDVMLWGPGSPMGEHANFVVVNDGTTITTVGGNQDGGISVRHNVIADTHGLLGYGRLT